MINLPKRYKTRRLPASKIRERIIKGRLEVINKVGSKLLQIKTADDLTTYPIYMRRHRRSKRMRLSAGDFLNSRWIPLGPRNLEWELIERLSEQELKEEHVIVRIEENGEVRWYRLIYEVVSSRSQLLRQRVHIRAAYARERKYKSTVLEAVEREFASFALRRARVTPKQLNELSTLHDRISQRLFVGMTSIQSRLATRDIVAFLDAWMEIEGLRGHLNRLSFIAENINEEARRRNFAAYLRNIIERLEIYISPEIRRSVRWARYHLDKAADASSSERIDGCRRHLMKVVDHLRNALGALREWDRKLPEQEREYIPRL
ncbi:MAG: hypothetical protein A2Z11_00565 [Candidatus Woykebacteria bacterium RBG_16_43_9]|uniref:Uncharacterized protein n=1 Tax=Candidatus Woykebacteria bacterium RBG_16_43_9 TaxID=1802596 RepID=A0A1G1WDM2_9BACT|nr:MAG: hypothetical protein A2Z11_00565 [Candidatus Woykebacteria bacterium RBG_16_43_9]